MAENTLKIEKSLIEKMAPFVLIALIIFLVYFAFTKIKPSAPSAAVSVNQIQKTPISVNIEFLNSEVFNNLKFIPDPSVFDEATGTIPSGRDDPFAPVN